MRALVIGGNGFIGSSLVGRLRAQGVAVRVLDIGRPRTDVTWESVEFVQGSLADGSLLPHALADVDVVFHLASATVPSTSNLDPIADVQSNLVGTLRLLQAMQATGVRRIVFFSSGGTVYGNPDVVPVPETHALRPISSYGVVKASIESYLGMYGQLGVIDPMVLRPSNPYGPRQSTSGVQGAIGAFLRCAREGRPVTLWGDGGTVRDYLYVDDLVELAVTAGLSDATGVYNAGSGEGHSLLEICRLIGDITGRPLEVRHEPGRSFDVRRIVLDVRRARDRFGWSPQVSLADGIAGTWSAIA